MKQNIEKQCLSLKINAFESVAVYCPYYGEKI